MKVYRRSEFMKLPEGTIYAKGKPWFFGDITVKGDTFGNDWTCLSPMWIESAGEDDQWSRLDGMLECGYSYPMASAYGRDGCFADDEIFLVLERGDLERLRGIVDAALVVAGT